MTSAAKIRSWQAFVAWCDARRLCYSPANPWTLAAYVRTLGESKRLDAIRRELDQIGQMHYEKVRRRPDRHATVKRTLDSIRRREALKKLPPPSPPLFRDEDFLAAGTPKPPRGRKPRTADAKRRSLRVKPPLVRRKGV